MDKINILIITENCKDQFNLIKSYAEQKKYNIDILKVKDEIEIMIYSEHLKPDILLIDVIPTIIDEVDLIEIIGKKTPSAGIILMNRKYIDLKYSLKNNIYGYINTDDDIEDIEVVICSALNKAFYVSSSSVKNIFNTNELIFEESNKTNITLSLTERKIIMQLIKGYTDIEIAESLKCSIPKIKKLIGNLIKKTKQKSRVQMVLYMFSNKIIKI